MSAGAARETADAAKERLRLWLRLLKLSRMIEGDLRERLRSEHETTLPRFDVMAALYRAEAGMKMSQLSGALRVSNGNITGIVDRLVADGMVVRAQVEGDRRAMLVRLTKRGREVFAALAAEHENWVDGLLAEVGPEEARALSGTLKRIADHLEEGAAG
ncbi:MAG: MarR family winged helix-turn-helix transcriptional regulator [Minwuia sp.]|uniref:MarR family winged helix-turn-helix transcriptional regulator n=1 Tax=Minwuia sp. TaxID=2493630 RepID=UPI003A8A6257